MPQQSHYAVLRVPRDSTLDDVKAAYRRRALETHPDKGGDPDEFKAVTEAYNVLRDDRSRRMYDAMLDMGPVSNADVVQCMFRLFKVMRGWGQAASGAGDPSSAGEGGVPEAIEIDLPATLPELYGRAVKRVSVRIAGVQGIDRVTLYVPLVAASKGPYLFRGMGDGCSSGERGDVIVRVRPELPPNIHIDDVITATDLLVDHSLDIYDFINADHVDVTLFPGTTVTVPYACGKDVAVVEGRGLPDPDGSGDDPRGSLYVYFRLAAPSRERLLEIRRRFQ